MGLYQSKPSPYDVYLDAVRNKTIINSRLESSFTKLECDTLLLLYPELPTSAQRIITLNCIDTGAGTGIHLPKK